MIVKIQVPLQTNADITLALVYNKDRSVMFQTEVNDEIKKFMGASYKKYADIDFDLGGLKIAKINKEVKAQSW